MSFLASANTNDSFRNLITAQGTVDATGLCTITFPTPQSGYYATGSVTVYDSPLNALWHVSFNGINIDTVSGVCSCSGMQTGPGDILTFTAKNLGDFIGQTYHGTFSAIMSPDSDTNLIVPSHDPFLSVTPGGSISTALATHVFLPSPGATVLVNTADVGPFFVTAAWATVFAAGSGGQVEIQLSMTGSIILMCGTAPSGAGNSTLSYPGGLFVPTGEVFAGTNVATVTGYAGITYTLAGG